jgi:uncharacterized phage protein (predicted DNA packaging)
MSVISLSEAKSHLRIDQSDEDTLIQLYIDAVDVAIENYLNLSNPPQNSAVKAAALLLVGNIYENREAYNEKELVINPTVASLLFPYRKDMGV